MSAVASGLSLPPGLRCTRTESEVTDGWVQDSEVLGTELFWLLGQYLSLNHVTFTRCRNLEDIKALAYRNALWIKVYYRFTRKQQDVFSHVMVKLCSD